MAIKLGASYRRWYDFELPFTRLLHEAAPYVDLKYSELPIIRPTAHLGQRKLFYSELELYTKVYEIEGPAMMDMLVVYVGAAPGTHTNLLIEMFPSLSFLLYDPNPFKIKPSDRVKIMTGDSGMFRLSNVPEVLEHAAGREIIFICDMRLNTKEENVWKEMTEQQTWGILLNAKYMLLKYRPPYVTDETMTEDYTKPDIPIRNRISVDSSSRCDYPFLYLDGDIFTQIYPPKTSSEARLFVVRPEDGKYRMKFRSFYEYENVCYFFNAVYRGARFRYKGSDDVPNHILGYDDGYESVGEYYLVDQFLHTLLGREPSHEEVVKTLCKLNIRLIETSNGDNPIFEIFDTYSKGYIKDTKGMKLSTRLYVWNNMLPFIRSHIALIPMIQSQIERVSSSSILTASMKQNQLRAYTVSKYRLIKIEEDGSVKLNMSIVKNISDTLRRPVA